MATESTAQELHSPIVSPVGQNLPELGVFYFDEVRTYLKATDLELRGDLLALSNAQISSWGKRGYFRDRRNRHDRNKRFIAFAELITTRMIAILRSYGISWRAIKSTHDYVKSETDAIYPFATKTFWTDDSEHPTHLYTVIDDRLVAADRWGQHFFRTLRGTKLVHSSGLEFSDDIAVMWEPHRDVLINPRVQGGAPCIKGTRVPTSVLIAAHGAGYPADEICKHFELTANQVETGLEWENRLRRGATRGQDERAG